MSELSMYKQQLEQIELALIDDPKNQELLTLKDDIADLINLMVMAAAPSHPPTKQSSEKAKPSTHASAASQPSPPSVATSIPTTIPATETTTASPVFIKTDWKVGDRCKAKWSVDGRFYDAQITAIGGPDNEMYSVTFTEYGNIELVRADALQTRGGNGSAQKRKTAEGEATRIEGGPDAATKKKKKKGPPTKSEVVEKQNAWLTFAKKGPKGKNAAPVATKKSMFSTPDNPNAKVGVIGSGAGMTSFVQRGKHIYGDAQTSKQ